ncbi:MULTISPECIES: hypothetical protein [Pseudomonadota]|jgi:hypothetical protein|uniref:hypothetical protein n=1 Tax=Pseudomonadota TaxID=1224 RepID=UPI000AFE818F|nr:MULTISPECIES: hypothetical protein [Pseudomonadota]
MGRSRSKPKAPCRADTRGGQWAGLPWVVIDSPAYQALSLYARAVLVEIVRRMDGFNNGKIAISQREIAARLGTSNFRAIGKAIAELMQHGFLLVSAEGEWAQRKAREYRLTFVSTQKGHLIIPATNDYLHWAPTQKSGADDVSAETGKSADDVSARPPFAADDVSARIARHQRKTAISAKSSADDVSSLIGKPYPPSGNGGEPTWTDIRNGGRSPAPGDDLINQTERAELRSLVIDYLDRTQSYARDIARHPACLSAGVTDRHLTSIRTGRNGGVKRRHAEAVKAAISN